MTMSMKKMERVELSTHIVMLVADDNVHQSMGRYVLADTQFAVLVVAVVASVVPLALERMCAVNVHRCYHSD